MFIEEGDEEEYNLRFHTFSNHQQQAFNLSQLLSFLFYDKISVYQRQEQLVINEASILDS